MYSITPSSSYLSFLMSVLDIIALQNINMRHSDSCTHSTVLTEKTC